MPWLPETDTSVPRHAPTMSRAERYWLLLPISTDIHLSGEGGAVHHKGEAPLLPRKSKRAPAPARAESSGPTGLRVICSDARTVKVPPENATSAVIKARGSARAAHIHLARAYGKFSSAPSTVTSVPLTDTAMPRL